MAVGKSSGVLGTVGRASPGAGRFPGTATPALINLLAVTAILYFGREVLLPLAVALLLTFALAPIVSFLRRRSLPRPAAVILTVAFAFAAIALLAVVVATQVANLAENITTYQYNILAKVQSLKEMGASGGIIDRLTGAVERVGAEIKEQAPASAAEAAKKDPLPVQIVPQQNPIETLKNIIVPLAGPFAMGGMVLVVVIFMLLEREELRDRFIRLVGYDDLHRTTEALQDAGQRVGHYLLMQLVVNTLYAIPITVGLWLLGIPNAVLWGLLTLVLRFVPYIGPAIGMLLPLFLAVAVAPGWSLVLWTAGLFLVVELISNNVIEPWLYGSRTGLSPLSIIVAAIFWTWMWGPIGLLLSTPLTVCLVVLGRYMPQFEFLDVLLGNEPVLEPHARLYQRLLAGDPDEATDNAEEILEEKDLVEYYDEIGIPALLLGELDRQRGVMPDDQRIKFSASAMTLVNNLEEIAEEESEEEAGGEVAAPAGQGPDVDAIALPNGENRSLVCFGGRGEIDDAAAAMLAQVLKVQGAAATPMPHTGLRLEALRAINLSSVDTAIITYLNAKSAAHASHAVRRLKRLRPNLRVGLLVPTRNGFDTDVSADRLNADFIARSVHEAVALGLSETEPVPLSHAPLPFSRRRMSRAKFAQEPQQKEEQL